MSFDPFTHYATPRLLDVSAASYLSGFRPRLRRVRTIRPLLSLAEARLHLKLDPLPVDEDGQLLPDDQVAAHPDDSLVKGLVLATQAEIDGPNSWTHRGAAATQWELTFTGFPSSVPLPLPPVASIDAVTYRAADGSRVTVSATAYELGGTEDRPALVLKAGESWPMLPSYDGATYADAVSVTFTTGYTEGHPDLELFKAYAKLRLGYYYENREAVVVGTIATPLPGWENLLNNLRVSHPDYLLGCV